MENRSVWGAAGMLVAVVSVFGACQGMGPTADERLDPMAMPAAPGVEMRPSALMGLRPARPVDNEPVQPIAETDPTNRFDRWLLGDESAITEDENLGYQLFKDLGCTMCHDGTALGTPDGDDAAASLRDLGDGPFFADGSAASLADAVRFMASEQFEAELSDRETRLIVEFLRTLRG